MNPVKASPALRIDDVVSLTKLSRASIYALAKSGKFPSPYKASTRVSVWDSREVEMYMTERAESFRTYTAASE